MAKLSVVLDTQLLLRGATARSASLNSKVYQTWIEGDYEVLLSQETLDELLRVLTEPKVVRQLRITNEILMRTATLLLSKAKFVTVSRKITLCREPNDDKFLEGAVTGRADFVVSADNDLLSLKVIEAIPIVSLPTFWRALQDQRSL